ncbi:heparinase II/III domain-containing protein [Nonomuraea sp. bgisy101]|uniref:heparinase II/III domain-containing protein n=1 Tax=Nonomuraea sp. bgisy101 TaxID=3413784 RepID=UPI003D75A16F
MSAAYTPRWPAILRRVETRPWAATILAAIRADFTRWTRELVIPGPERPSAWSHHYFCDGDGAPLVFDAATPARHACSLCGRVYLGEPWDGAWRTTMHNAAAVQAQRAALLVRLSNGQEPRAELERIAAVYARDYLAYEPHGVNAGTGRVLPQSLDEAVWAVGMLRALRWAGDALSPATCLAVDAMARAIVELLRPQVGMIHNIHCWLLAALAECAARLGDDELMAWCRDSPFGAETQVIEGFRPEGLWYEVNAHYHYYAVAALLSYREAAGPAGLSARAALRLSRAIAAPPSLAYADTRLPAYGDGWADCHVGDFASQAEAACAVVPEAPVDLAPYYERPRPGPVRPWFGNPATLPGCAEIQGRSSVAALVFGPDDVPAGSGDRASFVWPCTGIGLLRSASVRLAMRFGPDGGWHDHRDKLNVDVETATGWSSLDLGTSGYGSDFTAWTRSPHAHNLVIVDGARQPVHTGRLLESSARHLVAESAWEGTVLRRSVEVTDGGWTDEFTVTLAAPGHIEWVFHGDGRFAAAERAGAPAPDETALRDVRFTTAERAGAPAPDETALCDVRTLLVPPDRVLRGTWDVDGAPRLALAVPEGFEAYTATATGNPNGRPLGVILLRGHGDHARFHATFELSSERPRRDSRREHPR